jgi:hypothetical protein
MKPASTSPRSRMATGRLGASSSSEKRPVVASRAQPQASKAPLRRGFGLR